MKHILLPSVLLPMLLFAQGKIILPPRPPVLPLPPPVIRPVDLRADEQPVAVETAETIVEQNAFFRRVKTTFTFTNPNARVMQGDFEFPIPDGAFVCGYALEVNGEMVPGVVCEKEKARGAFENEVRKGVDPGLVEQVKGNIWKTRIFPLNPKTPRKAEVEWIRPATDAEQAANTGGMVVERDGDAVFCAELAPASGEVVSVTDKIAAFKSGVLLWDASLSRLGKTASDRARLEFLPETGDWQLIVFADTPEAPRTFTSRADLIAAIDALIYDGGTDIAAARAAIPRGTAVLIFTDEMDTLAERPVDLEGDPSVVIGSRPDVAPHPVTVRKLTADEIAKLDAASEVRPSTLLATVWAARRMQDLASQADMRKDEFLALGRKYGVAGPGLSLIVLERLQQWLDNKIEPPANLAIHDEWVRRRAAEDDPIAEKKAKADHEARLLRYWEERVKWWNNPKPPKQTPSSGLFDAAVAAPEAAQMARLQAAPQDGRANRMREAAPQDGRANRRRAEAKLMVMEETADADAAAAPVALAMESAPVAMKAKAPGAAGSATAPKVTLKAWDPKTPYIAALNSAGKGDTYAVYLKQRESYKDSPAFYLDCAGWFFSAGEEKTALRVISNLAEFKLENVALWRTMGWRLREAAVRTADPAVADAAVRAFRKALALRGEEGQSRRDLALVLMERGKRTRNVADLAEAMRLLHEAAFVNHARRSTRRGNDFQVAIIALEELNGLLAWCAANKDTVGAVAEPAMDAAYRRDLPVKLRIVLSWDADETDIDLHVLEPNGEEAFYGHRRTAEGGFVSEDVTTGYGPEEYLKKDLERGVYKVLSNYYASHQTTLTGATTVQATVYTDWATAQEKMQVLTLRLDKPKDKHLIGEIEVN